MNVSSSCGCCSDTECRDDNDGNSTNSFCCCCCCCSGCWSRCTVFEIIFSGMLRDFKFQVATSLAMIGDTPMSATDSKIMSLSCMLSIFRSCANCIISCSCCMIIFLLSQIISRIPRMPLANSSIFCSKVLNAGDGGCCCGCCSFTMRS